MSKQPPLGPPPQVLTCTMFCQGARSSQGLFILGREEGRGAELALSKPSVSIRPRGPFPGQSLSLHSLFSQHLTPLTGLGNQPALGICILTHHYQLPDLGEVSPSESPFLSLWCRTETLQLISSEHSMTEGIESLAQCLAHRMSWTHISFCSLWWGREDSWWGPGAKGICFKKSLVPDTVEEVTL